MFNFYAFIFKITLAIVDSLHFHIRFRIIFLISFKTLCWNFIEIVLNLLICLGKIDIYTILTFPVSSVFCVQITPNQQLDTVTICFFPYESGNRLGSVSILMNLQTVTGAQTVTGLWKFIMLHTLNMFNLLNANWT